MNLFRHFRDVVVSAIAELVEDGVLPAGLSTEPVAVEPPRDPAHGDVATNAAMVLAKGAGMKPRAIAERLAEVIGRDPAVTAATVAGPGFINLRLADDFWRERVREVLAAGLGYGDSDIGAGRRVNVEYVSANPTGPLHIGHCRGAVYGDALAALLEKAGFDVTREYYSNDAGQQIDVLARSAYLRYREALGEEIGPIPDGLYPGEYLKDVGLAIADRDGTRWQAEPESAWIETFRQAATEMMTAEIRADLADLGIEHSVFTSERELQKSGRVEEAVGELERRGLLYTGVLDPPKGKASEDWEPRPQLLFKATEFGDDVDRALRKSDGTWTYFAADIAYHWDKFRRGFKEMIDVFGADHGGYVKRMKAATKAITGGEGSLDIKLCQLVRLSDAGEPVKMSKRAGTFVMLREVVDRVGRDVVRFIMLTRRNDAPLEFDFAKVTEQSKDNPVFYVQYAHARAHSVFRNARETLPALELCAGDPFASTAIRNADLSHLDEPAEFDLMKRLADWPRIVETAADHHEPHRVAFYLHDLASAFHGLWTKGKETGGLRIIVAEDAALTAARLALVAAVATVVASGLKVMGVVPIEEMR